MATRKVKLTGRVLMEPIKIATVLAQSTSSLMMTT
jgi:hypothetical protein